MPSGKLSCRTARKHNLAVFAALFRASRLRERLRTSLVTVVLSTPGAIAADSQCAATIKKPGRNLTVAFTALAHCALFR